MGGGAVPTYDIPMGRGDKDKSFWHPKGSKGPRLKGKKVNEDSQTETQWKGGSFVKVKDECNKFPYCDQGAGAIELKKTKRAVISNDHIVQEVAKKTNRTVDITGTRRRCTRLLDPTPHEPLDPRRLGQTYIAQIHEDKKHQNMLRCANS